MIRTKAVSLLVGMGLAAIGLMTVMPAQAQVTFTPGNNPQSNEENILLNSGQTGATVTGTTQQSGILVQFASTTDTLTEPSNGQARVEAQDGVVNDITISVPNGTFTDLIINPFIGGSNKPPDGTLDIVVMSSGGTQNFSLAIGNGSNFGTFVADTGVTINSVTLSSTTGFSDLRQPRISGVANGNPGGGGVPEPGSLGLLVGVGVTGSVLAAGRLRRRR